MKDSKMNFFINLSPAKKLGFVFLSILILSSISVSLVYYFQDLQKADGAIIDASGRDRMLSQRMSFYAEQVINGNNPGYFAYCVRS